MCIRDSWRIWRLGSETRAQNRGRMHRRQQDRLESMRSRYRPRGHWLKLLATSFVSLDARCKKFTSNDRNSLVGPASGGLIHKRTRHPAFAAPFLKGYFIWTVTALERSRPAADATREVVGDGCLMVEISCESRGTPRDSARGGRCHPQRGKCFHRTKSSLAPLAACQGVAGYSAVSHGRSGRSSR